MWVLEPEREGKPDLGNRWGAFRPGGCGKLIDPSTVGRARAARPLVVRFAVQCVCGGRG